VPVLPFLWSLALRHKPNPKIARPRGFHSRELGNLVPTVSVLEVEYEVGRVATQAKITVRQTQRFGMDDMARLKIGAKTAQSTYIRSAKY
jgi:hypothetical protein